MYNVELKTQTCTHVCIISSIILFENLKSTGKQKRIIHHITNTHMPKSDYENINEYSIILYFKYSQY